MNRMWSKLKLIGGILSLIALVVMMSCGTQFEEPFDSEEQLEKDIELIEAYIAEYIIDNGPTDYDTLNGDVRVLVLNEGSGETIEPNDIISYNYVGLFMADVDTLFDTSIRQLAYDQDVRNIIDTTFVKKADGTFDLDANGKKKVSKINYTEGYFPIYSSTRTYSPSKTTHTSTGWFTNQVLSSTVSGYAPAVNYALFNCKIGGSALAILPSSAAYGRFGSGTIAPNTVIMFEIRPVQKR